MKIKLPNKKRLIIVGSVALSFLVAGSAFFLLKDRAENPVIDAISLSREDPQLPENNVNYTPPTSEERAEAQRQKEDIIKESENPPASNGTLQAIITRARQNDAGQPLAVRILVKGTTSGTCTITLSKAGQTTITRAFPVVFEATSSSCGAANIEASDFPVEGIWQLSVEIANGSAVSEAVKSEANIAK